MPANTPSINLIKTGDFEQSAWGRIVSWATTYGRYIMISTEIVVLLAFVSRFSLDRKLTDLQEEISQKQVIIEANIPFENKFRQIQTQMVKVQKLLAVQTIPLDILQSMQVALPVDVFLESFEINDTAVRGQAVVGSTTGLAQLISNLGAMPDIAAVSIGDIRKQAAVGIQLEFTAEIAGKQKTTEQPIQQSEAE